MAYEIEIKGLNKLHGAIKRSPKQIHRGLNKSIRNALHIIRPVMVEEAPRGETGNLRKNIQTSISGLKGSVGPNLNVTPYALWVHQGTSPYFIRPKTKDFLHFKVNGRWVKTKRVFHPGINANPYVRRTYKRVEEPVRQIFQKEINKWIDNNF